MNSINSTFKTNLQEFSAVANNISSQILSVNTIEREDLLSIEKKIDFLTPICEKYQVSFRDGDISIDEDTVLKLENAATSLWNTLSIAMKTVNVGIPKDVSTEVFNLNALRYNVAIKCKYFVCLILEIYQAITGESKNITRNLKCSIATLKYCTEFGDLKNVGDVKTKILNFTQNQLDRALVDVEEGTINNLKFDFYLCCFQISMIEKDFANATIYENKLSIESNLSQMTANSIIELSRVIYNSLLDIQNSQDAAIPYTVRIKLLERNIFYLTQPIENLKAHISYEKVKFSSLILLIETKLEDKSIDTLEIINLVEKLLKEYPTNCESYSFAIKCFRKIQSDNMIKQIETTVMDMMISVDVSSNIESLIGCLTDLSSININVGLKCLDYLIENKLKPDIDQSMLEKLLCVRFYLTTQSKELDNSEKVNSLTSFTGQIERIISKELTKTTLATIITLLWNEGKKAEKKDLLEEAVPYFELACSDIYSRSYHDKAKIQRNLANIYLQLGNFKKAYKWYESMSTNDKLDPLSLLIKFKILLQEKRLEQAEEIIEEIVKNRKSNTLDVLMLIITESKSIPSISLKAILLLYELLEPGFQTTNVMTDGSVSMNMLTLTRYTIQMLVKINEENFVEQTIPYMEVICKMLNKVLAFLKNMKLIDRSCELERESTGDTKSGDVVITEVEWFTAICYNIGLKFHEADTNNEAAAMIMECCLQFFNHFPFDDLTFPKKSHYFHWKIRSCILEYLILKKLGAEKATYVDVLLEKGRITFTTTLQFIDSQDYKDAKTQELEIETQEVLLTAAQQYIEALTKQNLQHEIYKVVNDVAKYANPDLDEVIIEELLDNTTIHKETIVNILTQIIRRNLDHSNSRAVKLFYWIRRCIEIAINSEVEMSIDIIETTTTLLATRYKTEAETSEILKQDIEMTATFCWNKGVNYILENKRNDGQLWCLLSIKLAHYGDINFKKKLEELWDSLSTQLTTLTAAK